MSDREFLLHWIVTTGFRSWQVIDTPYLHELEVMEVKGLIRFDDEKRRWVPTDLGRTIHQWWLETGGQQASDGGAK